MIQNDLPRSVEQFILYGELSSLEETEHDWDAGGYCPALYGDPCRCQEQEEK